MGEIADKMVNGEMCACCGVYLEPNEIVYSVDDLGLPFKMPSDGSSLGFPVYCKDCDD